MMDVLFGGSQWTEPYIKNQFLYVTDHDSDFEGDKGKELLEYFKKVYYLNYQKYSQLVAKNLPEKYEEYREKHVQKIQKIYKNLN